MKIKHLSIVLFIWVLIEGKAAFAKAEKDHTQEHYFKKKLRYSSYKKTTALVVSGVVLIPLSALCLYVGYKRKDSAITLKDPLSTSPIEEESLQSDDTYFAQNGHSPASFPEHTHTIQEEDPIVEIDEEVSISREKEHIDTNFSQPLQAESLQSIDIHLARTNPPLAWLPNNKTKKEKTKYPPISEEVKSLLTQSIINGDSSFFSKLKDLFKKDPNSLRGVDEGGNNLLHYLVYNSTKSDSYISNLILEWLIEDVGIDPQDMNKEKYTPAGYLDELINKLKKRKTELSAKKNKAKYEERGEIEILINSLKKEIGRYVNSVYLLIKHTTHDFFMPHNPRKSTAAHCFLKHVGYNRPCYYLLFRSKVFKDKEHIDQEDDEGNTALCYALIYETYVAIATLLDAGANVNHENKDGESALTLAIKYSPEVANYDGFWGNDKKGAILARLCLAGANLYKKTKKGEVPINLLAMNDEDFLSKVDPKILLPSFGYNYKYTVLNSLLTMQRFLILLATMKVKLPLDIKEGLDIRDGDGKTARERIEENRDNKAPSLLDQFIELCDKKEAPSTRVKGTLSEDIQNILKNEPIENIEKALDVYYKSQENGQNSLQQKDDKGNTILHLLIERVIASANEGGIQYRSIVTRLINEFIQTYQVNIYEKNTDELTALAMLGNATIGDDNRICYSIHDLFEFLLSYMGKNFWLPYNETQSSPITDFISFDSLLRGRGSSTEDAFLTQFLLMLTERIPAYKEEQLSDENGITALLTAARNCILYEVIDGLLYAGANPNALTKRGVSVLSRLLVDRVGYREKGVLLMLLRLWEVGADFSMETARPVEGSQVNNLKQPFIHLLFTDVVRKESLLSRRSFSKDEFLTFLEIVEYDLPFFCKNDEGKMAIELLIECDRDYLTSTEKKRLLRKIEERLALFEDIFGDGYLNKEINQIISGYFRYIDISIEKARKIISKLKENIKD